MTKDEVSGSGNERLRLLAFVEGASLLLLVGIAVPLKHLAHVAIATRVMGMIHGLAFLTYFVAVIDALATRRLSGKRAFYAIVAAMIPGGSFVFARGLRG